MTALLLLILLAQSNADLRGEIADAQRARDIERLNGASSRYVRSNLAEVSGWLAESIAHDTPDFVYTSREGTRVRFRIPERIFYSGEIRGLRLANDVKLGELRPTRNAAGSVGVPLVVDVVDRLDGPGGLANARPSSAVRQPTGGAGKASGGKPGAVEPVVRSIPVTVTLEHAGGEFGVTLHDPRITTEATVAGRTVPLRRNLAAPIALAAERIRLIEPDGTRDPTPFVGRAGIYWAEPNRAAKEALVFVHGLSASPADWAAMVNSAMEDPEISRRYSIAVAYYPTGLDPNVAAELLAKDLARDRKILGFERAVMAGHSLGGVITKVALTRPELARQLPFVDKAVFISAPVEGSPVSRILNVPLLNWFAHRQFGRAASLLALDPKSDFIRDLKTRQPAVEHHVLASDRIRWLRDLSYTLRQPFFLSWRGLARNDGSVTVKSQTAFPDASSVSIFHENHVGILRSDAAFAKLRQILLGAPETPGVLRTMEQIAERGE